MSTRRKINVLLKQIKIFTPGAILRWRIIGMIFKLLLEKRDRKIPYEYAYIRNKDLVRKIRKPTSVGSVVRMLLRFKPPILSPLDEKEEPPQTHFSIDGVLMLKDETEIWNEIFSLTDEYDLLKPLVQILRQRLDEIDRYIQGSGIHETKAK